jgi:hypothetical protein
VEPFGTGKQEQRRAQGQGVSAGLSGADGQGQETQGQETQGQETTVFTEVQRSTGWFRWILIAFGSFSIIGFFLWLIWGIELGNMPPSNIAWLLSFASLALIIVPLTMIKLTTRITDAAIYVRLSPPPLYLMHPNRFAWTSVKRAYIREYHEFKEYGGIGIRYAGPSVGEAITMNGSIGLQLELTNGQKMLISTRNPEELKAALAGLKAQGVAVVFE